MKACLSILFAIIILVVFIGTAGLLWYASSSTEIHPAPKTEDTAP